MATPDWLRYANQSAIRNQPLNPKLIQALSFLPELGVTMQVASGGETPERRASNSGRHLHGNAADADFFMGDRKLTPKNEQDLSILSQIVQRGKANGITGWGEGDDYMGSGRVHLGYGAPGIWGAGGKGANAPGWLSSAYNGIGSQVAAQQASSPQASGSAAPAMGAPINVGSAPTATAGIMGAFAPTPQEPAQQQPSFAQGMTDFKNGDYLQGVGNVFGSLGGGSQQQAPQAPPPMQLAPVQGPSSQQATALANYVQALLGKKVANG